MRYRVFKLIGLSILVMISLIVLSVLEVTIYSYLVNSGKEVSVYENHANLTAPYISGICGFIIFFFITRYWTKKSYPAVKTLAIVFPFTYILLDLVVILLTATVQWSDFILVFAIANAAKVLGSYLGYQLTNKNPVINNA